MPERYLGRTLGKFRIDALIGTGGFAWVYKAWDPELEIPVALKVLKPQYAGDEKFESRFRREAATAAKLRHPNIVKIFAVGKEDDAVFFAMDYLPHGLADRLDVMGTLPESMLIRMGIDVASALGFAHREGVIHRDIKVDNILFDEHGNAIVADFGIARAVSNYVEQTGTNMVVGTPQYFSPEQARGQTLDGRADIYSLGITLFRSATGELPFPGEDWYEIARQHVEDDPPRPRTINAALSKDIERIILTCLEKDPDDRWQSGEQLCQALARLLQDRGEGMAAGRTLAVPAMETASSPMRAILPRLRRKTKERAVQVAGVAAVVVAAAAAGAMLFRDQGPAVAATAPTVPPGGTMGRGGDGGGGATLPPPPPRVLALSAPGGATLTVDGVSVGRGSWRSDTLRPGRHVVVARLAPMPGCAATIDSAVVALDSSGTRNVRLEPRSCGRVILDIAPAAARWTLSAAGRATLRGTGTPPAPVILAAGTWRLAVEGPRFCSQFNGTVDVVAGGAPRRERVRLICEGQ